MVGSGIEYGWLVSKHKHCGAHLLESSTLDASGGWVAATKKEGAHIGCKWMKEKEKLGPFIIVEGFIHCLTNFVGINKLSLFPFSIEK